MKNVAALTGDNCPNNLNVATTIHYEYVNVYLVICGSHMFNLAVKGLIEPFKGILEKAQKIIK